MKCVRLMSWACPVPGKKLSPICRWPSTARDFELAYWPMWLTVILPALHKIGLTYALGACSGGAPLPPVVHETLEAWGVPIRDMFGMTETGGIGAQTGKWPAPESAIR